MAKKKVKVISAKSPASNPQLKSRSVENDGMDFIGAKMGGMSQQIDAIEQAQGRDMLRKRAASLQKAASAAPAPKTGKRKVAVKPTIDKPLSAVSWANQGNSPEAYADYVKSWEAKQKKK